MNKLKLLVLTALAAATVGTGALAAAPSASAMTFHGFLCDEMAKRASAYGDKADYWMSRGDPLGIGTYYQNLASDATNEWLDECN